jgi:hypothetical protein
MQRSIAIGVPWVVSLLTVICTAATALGVADRRFDICTIFNNASGSDPHFTTTNLSHLNFSTANGHFISMPTDTNRPTINANGNFMAGYYNTLNSLYGVYNGSQAADQIQNYLVANFTSNGVVPQWLILNEISSGSWQSDANYRAWLRTCIGRLKATYNHATILCAPFTHPASSASDWQALSQNCYIGIEGYLTGAAVNGSGNSSAWCATQYSSFKTSYLNLGIASSQLFLVEHYANTVSGTAWGRSGVSSAGWDNAIRARMTGMKSVGFAGYVGFAWEHNGMGITETEQDQHEDAYAAQSLP